ncbi:hypothetical protein QQS21_005672 [Conoideocrella luteorostrata]|uniref:DUF7779 domain-containing protein n=1 Tax=Conoideocrella luteorostrata TaxID=1105319 RepID=A0AAJ0CNZ8_9HYPO|nr:hypothetical protein QQS21_005672 [Conoideocrella luteorostrata]
MRTKHLLGDLRHWPTSGNNWALVSIQKVECHSSQCHSTDWAALGMFDLSRTCFKHANQSRKTQIALAYVYWLKEACPEVSVFWVHASNAERFRQSFAQIAEDCQIPGHDDPKTNVLILAKEWLCKKDNGQWLMVIDNADDGKLFCGQSKCATDDDPHINENLAQYVPECGHGKVLATTRNKQVAVKLSKSIRTVEIHKMDESESIQLLGTFTDIDTHEASFVELSTLSSRLEHLPLALVQAAAFIQANGISIKKYLQLLEESDQSLVSLLSKEFESIGRDSEAPQAVAQTWIISFRLIWEQNTLAGSLLSLMSLFDKQAIPMAFLSHYAAQERNGGPKSSIELTESIGLLKAFSLLSEQKGESLDMHRLVQLVTRKWLMNDHAMGQFEQEALLTVSHVYPFGVFENRTLCSAYLPHAKAVLGIKVDDAQDGAIAEALLSHRVASYLNFEGQWSDAEKLYKEALTTRKMVLGEQHPDTLRSMANLASTYRYQGRWKEAEELQVQVMETHKTVLGEQHPDTLTSMANLASTYRNQGRWKEAEELKVQVMKSHKTVLGEQHPDTLISIANLASIYWDQGQWKEAEELEVQVMETRKTVLGEQHPDTLISMGNLASTYWNQGRWKEAEELEVQVMESRKKVLGEQHPDTLISIANLASIYQDQGRWKEAEELEVQVMETRKTVLGEQHPDTLRSIANLASIYRDQGRWKEAEELEVQVIETRKIVLGEQHPDTLTSIANLALTYQNQGRWKEAEELEVQVIETHKTVLGEQHPNTLRSITNLASTYWNQGRWKEAEELEVQAMEIRKTVLGEQHPDTLTSMANLAFTWDSQGSHMEAIKLMESCCRLQQSVLGVSHPHTESTLSTLNKWKLRLIED